MKKDKYITSKRTGEKKREKKNADKGSLSLSAISNQVKRELMRKRFW